MSFDINNLEINLFEEKSHSKLKYDFRLGWDYNTGHQIKVVYSLDNIKIDNVGKFYWKYNPNNEMNEEEYMNYVNKNIQKEGNNDHNSRGQKVLAIVDMVNNKSLNEVELMSPFLLNDPEYKFTKYKAIPENILKKAQEISKSNNGVNKIKVGTIDNKSSFKATSWGKNTTNLRTGEDFRFNQIAKKEFLKNGRGSKINDIIPEDLKVFGFNGRPPTHYNNPNKKEALIELNTRAVDCENLMKCLLNSINNNDYPNGWDRESTIDFYKQTKHKLAVIDNDISTIKNGKYDLSIMKKYKNDDFNIKKIKHNRLHENTDFQLPIDLDSLSMIAERNMIKEELLLSETSIMNEEIEGINEASHGKLKYDFRRAYDIDTGHALKIVYSLDNIEVTYIGNGSIKKDASGNFDEEHRKKRIQDVQKNIKYKGNMDHASKGQKILAIIDRVTGENLKREVNIIGPYAPGVSNSFLNLPDDNLTYIRKNIEESPKFKERYISSIKVGDIDNNSLYKSTFWPKNDVNINKYRNGYEYKSDNVGGRNTSGEALDFGRGIKLNDLNDTIGVGNFPGYQHPSKKDIRQNPELYKDHLSDEKFEKLMKTKSPGEIKEDIKDVKEEINKLNNDIDVSDNNSEEIRKKKSILSILKENLKKLIEWIKNLARNIGLIESVIEYLDEEEICEYIEINYNKETDDMEYMEAVIGKVIDGYLSDLPEDIQKNVIEISKIISSEVNSLIKDDKYEDLKNSRWAMSCLDDFCVKPSPKDEIGSFRLYQKKKTYECMIQCTGHFRNHQYGWIEDLLNTFIKDLFQRVRPIVRKKYDMTLKSEGEYGNPDEGFDVYPSRKIAEELWNKFQDLKIKTLRESSYDIMDEEIEGINEASHSKLKYDFRLGFDYDTGHSVKIVYSLDNIQVDMGGSAYKKDEYGHKKSRENLAHRSSDSVTSQIANTIRKKGDLDHASHGQKVLAIVDRVTNKKLTSSRVIGLFDARVRSSFKSLELTPSDKKYIQMNINKNDFPIVEVGKIDNTSSFKSTKWFKGNLTHKDEFEDDIIDLKPEKISAAEKLKYGRGAKMDDIDEWRAISGDIVYNHPSKKDIKRNPNRYKESKEFTEGFFDIFKNKKKFDGGRVAFGNLPEGLRNLCKDTTAQIKEEFIKSAESLGLLNKTYHVDDNSHGGTDYDIRFIADIISGKQDDYMIYDTYILKNHNNTNIVVSSSIGTFFDITTDELTNDVNKILNKILNNISKSFNSSNPGKVLLLDDTYSDGKFHETELYFIIRCDKAYTEKLINFINNPKNYPMTESTDSEDNPDYKKEYNTEMTEKQAKQTLRTLSQSIINNYEDSEIGKGKNKISQYTANIYANIITKNLLPKWASGYKKFSITLDSYQSFNTLEFKVPTMSQDFISRFIDGKEPMSAFLHRIPEIKIKISPRIFHTMENPDDAFNFFKSAIQYYDKKVEKYANSLMMEVFKLNHNMKHLIGTTKLGSIITTPLHLIFKFENVKMTDKDTFVISKEDISAINQFVRNIYTSYAAPEKEKKKIVEDMKSIVKDLRENFGFEDDPNTPYLVESVESFLFGKYDNEYNKADLPWILENTDIESMRSADYRTTALYEKFGVKKLKKIPSDLIAYITIEGESIKDANDKMMIASYCCSKIEIVEWYIELLEVGSKKYIVPHTLPYLQNMRTQLLQCYKKIMDTPIPKSDRSIISVKYPKRYEG